MGFWNEAIGLIFSPAKPVDSISVKDHILQIKTWNKIETKIPLLELNQVILHIYYTENGSYEFSYILKSPEKEIVVAGKSNGIKQLTEYLSELPGFDCEKFCLGLTTDREADYVIWTEATK